MDLTRLRLLREFARRGTMTAVADALRLTSSAVSQQFATLEHEAGVALFERVGRRVQLTSEGGRLAAHAETILEAVECAEQDLAVAPVSARGVIEVGSFATFAKARLIPALVRLRERWPELSVTVHELEPPDAVEALREGRCQLALSFIYNLAPRSPPPGLAAQFLLEEPVLLAAPAGERADGEMVDLERLKTSDWIVGSRQVDDRLLAERACALSGFAPKVTHTVDDYDLMLRMVAAGLGIGFVPSLALEFASLEGIVLLRPASTPLVRRIEALTRSTLARSRAVELLLAELGGVAAQFGARE